MKGSQEACVLTWLYPPNLSRDGHYPADLVEGLAADAVTVLPVVGGDARTARQGRLHMQA